MRVKLGQAPAALEKARDCFLAAATIMDVRCDIVKAERTWRRDPNAAKEFLRAAMRKGAGLIRMVPEKESEAKALVRHAQALVAQLPPAARKLPIGKGAEIAKGIERAIGELEEIYTASKARCGLF